MLYMPQNIHVQFIENLNAETKIRLNETLCFFNFVVAATAAAAVAYNIHLCELDTFSEKKENACQLCFPTQIRIHFNPTQAVPHIKGMHVISNLFGIFLPLQQSLWL